MSDAGNMTNITNITNNTNITNATDMIRIAGTLQVQIDVRGNISEEVVQDMFRRAIAAAINVSVELVVKLEVSEMHASAEVNSSESNGSEVNSSEVNSSGVNSSSGLRRLLSSQSKWYEVAYEVVVPSDMDADAAVSRANRIAVTNSTESLLFRQVLMATDGVEKVGEIMSMGPASKVGKTTAAPKSQPSEEDERSLKAIVIGAIAILLGLICLVGSAIFIKRKVSPSDVSKNESPARFAPIDRE
jgi:hypothetical protein